MQSTIKTGRIIGALLFAIVALGVLGLNFRNLSLSMAWSPKLLEQLFENDLQIRVSILLDVLVSIIWLVIAVIIFPIISNFKKSFAYWFFGIWILHFAVILFSNAAELSLLSIAETFNNRTDLEENTLVALATIELEGYFWSHYFAIMLFGLAMAPLYYIFFKTKLIPRFLSLWGMIAMILVLSACWLTIFNQTVSFAFFGQNGVHLLVMIGWLLIKGFNNPTIAVQAH
ncbi:MAG: DUF4386 domain-containing protein [Bacteroidota bacterium]